MQLFLTLSSNQSNFTKRENEISWSLHNFDVGCNQYVGLASLTIELIENESFESNTDMLTNLIDKSYFNETGIIYTIPGKGAIAKRSDLVEFWRLDTRKPENVTFTFRHANVNKIKNLTLTLAFTTQF